jgi:hypothetical protein
MGFIAVRRHPSPGYHRPDSRLTAPHGHVLNDDTQPFATGLIAPDRNNDAVRLADGPQV